MDSVAELLIEPGGVEQTLSRITHSARLTVPAADFASISIRHDNGRLETFAPTSPLMYRADGLQNELNEGPCFDALTDEDFIYCPDLGVDPRWPRFGPGASAMGLLSQLAFRLAHQGESYTILNLYARARNAFEDHHGVAYLFASHAKVVLAYSREVRALQAALSTRMTISRATGIVMERHGIDAERALELLAHMAQVRESNLLDVAERIVKPAIADEA
jgi:hypothetical protein